MGAHQSVWNKLLPNERVLFYNATFKLSMENKFWVQPSEITFDDDRLTEKVSDGKSGSSNKEKENC